MRSEENALQSLHRKETTGRREAPARAAAASGRRVGRQPAGPSLGRDHGDASPYLGAGQRSALLHSGRNFRLRERNTGTSGRVA